MCFKKWESKIEKLSFCDMACVKLASIAFALMVFKGIDIIWHWNVIEGVRIWWWLAIFIILALKPMIKFYGGKCKDKTE